MVSACMAKFGPQDGLLGELPTMALGKGGLLSTSCLVGQMAWRSWNGFPATGLRAQPKSGSGIDQ